MASHSATVNIMELHEISHDEGERLFSRQRFARILDVSVETVGRKIKAGEIRSVKLGRLVRIPASELSRLLATNSGATEITA